MTKLRLLGAAAVVLSSALAGPAMAQQVITNPGYCAQFYPDANCQNKGPGNPYTGDYQRRIAARNAYRNNGNWNDGWDSSWNDNRWDRRSDTGFCPADVAPDGASGPMGTAGATAPPPFRANSYT